MIISGFYGMGKSTFVKAHPNLCTELESSNYDKTKEDWFVKYCKDAIELEKTNSIVFVSSHISVYLYLLETHRDNFIILIPDASKGLRWLDDRLYKRFLETQSFKDEKALYASVVYGDAEVKEALSIVPPSSRIIIGEGKFFSDYYGIVAKRMKHK
jgi:hypothetical protein